MRNACLSMVYTLAKADPRVVFVGSDLGPSVLSEMKREFPNRFFMEGVSEQHIVGFAAGLAIEGFIPYVNTIATFITRRCFEQVALDLCLHNLPVRLIGNGGGLVYAPLGPTHLAIEDMAIMRALPNMTIVSPSDADEMSRFMERSIDIAGPVYIRLGKGGDPIVSREDTGFEVGKSISLRSGCDILMVSTGVMTSRALVAAEILDRRGISCGVLHMHTVKPLDHRGLSEHAIAAGLVVTIEEHTLPGGFGSAVLESLSDNLGQQMPPVERLGIPDTFAAHYGSQDAILESYNLQPEAIAEAVAEAFTTN
ncbi:MAG: transketolase [Magnetovibrio sp.]|nr:transketolase [Magnetovibrio sp.]